MRVDFEFTATDAAELQLQLLAESREASSWRRREQALFVAGLALTLVIAFLLTAKDRRPMEVLIAAIGAVIAGIVLLVPFRWYYDDLIRTRILRFLREQLGGEGPHPCSIELRPEHVWVRQAGVELLFPWSEATSVSDEPRGVLIVFRNGRVLARSRGFTSPEQRTAFLERARELAASDHGDQTT